MLRLLGCSLNDLGFTDDNQRFLHARILERTFYRKYNILLKIHFFDRREKMLQKHKHFENIRNLCAKSGRRVEAFLFTRNRNLKSLTECLQKYGSLFLANVNFWRDLILNNVF